MGRKHSEATKLKLSQIMKGKNKGKVLSQKTKDAMSEAHKGTMLSQKTKDAIAKAMKGKNKGKKYPPRSPEHIEALSKARKGVKPPPFSPEWKEAISEAIKKCWKDPEYAMKVLKYKGEGSRAEQRLLKVLNRMYPGEWKFVGNGKLLIDGKVPDFANGKNLVIEMFGDYWHSKECTGLDEDVHERQRVEHFTKSGYSTLVIWESELNSLQLLGQKIERFVENDK